jgi:hypothetical protein
MEPHVSRSTQSDITLYPGLAGEHFRSITFRQLGLLTLVMATIVIVINGISYWYLFQVDRIDRGNVIVGTKWNMIQSLEAPAGTLILGDSSINQSVNPAYMAGSLPAPIWNLATIGSWGFTGDEWMLRYHLEHYGTPQMLIIAHTYDVPNRNAPTVEIAATSNISPQLVFTPPSPFASPALTDLASYIQWHSFPLFYRRTTLRNAMIVQLVGQTISEYSFLDNGFMIWQRAIPDNLISIREEHIEVITSLMDNPRIFSPANTAALNRIIDLADEYDFPLILAYGPSWIEVENDPRFRVFREQLSREYEEFAARSDRVYFLDDVMRFEADVMEGFDHTTVAASEAFTRHLLAGIQAIQLSDE